MKRALSRFAALLLFGSFAASSGAFASTQDDLVEEPLANQTTQCTVNWKADSVVCKDRKDAASGKCTEKYQGSHASLAEAKERCEHISGVHLNSGVESCDPCWVVKSTQNDCVEHCKDLCYQLWEKCRDRCPRKDRNCLSECSNDLGRCNRECDRKCR